MSSDVGMRNSTRKSSSFRLFLIFVFILCAFIILSLVLSVWLLNSRWGLNLVETQLSESIQKNVTIESMKVRIGQTIRFQLTEVSIANPSWVTTPYLATIESLALHIDAFELLGGNLVFSKIHAAEPLFHLEQSTDGKKNWQVGTSRPSSHNSQSFNSPSRNDENETIKLPRIKSVFIDDGRLTYDDPNTSTLIHLSFGSESHEAFSEKSSLLATGGGSVFGQPLKIDLSVGSHMERTDEQVIGYPLKLQVESVDTHLLAEGQMDALVSPETAHVHMKLEGKELSRWNDVFKAALPTIPSYKISGDVILADGTWSLNPVHVAVEKSDLTGTLAIKLDEQPPRINGDFSSERLDVSQLQQYLPTNQQSDSFAQQIAGYLHTIANVDGQGAIRYRANKLVTKDWPVNDVDISLILDESTVTLKNLSSEVGGTHVNAEGHVSMEENQAEGHIKFQIAPESSQAATSGDVRTIETTSLLGLPGRLSGELAIGAVLYQPMSQRQSSKTEEKNPADQATSLKSVTIQNFQLRYADPSSHTDIVAGLIEGAPNQAMNFKANGEYRGTPMDLSLTLPSLELLTGSSHDSESDQHISADLHMAQATVSIRGEFKPDLPPTHMKLHFLLKSAKSAITAKVLGIDLPTLGNLAIDGSISKHGNLWNIQKLDARLGKSHLRGSGKIKTVHDIRFAMQLDSPFLDLTPWVSTPGTSVRDRGIGRTSPRSRTSSSNASENSPTEISLPTWLKKLTGVMSLDVKQSMLPEAKLNDISMNIGVHDGVLRIAPLFLTLGGGAITLMSQLDLTAPGLAGSFKISAQQVALGEAMQTFGREAADMGEVSGLVALRLPSLPTKAKRVVSVDTLLERLRIEEVRLRYDDPALQAKSDLRLTAESLSSGAQITGTVEYRERPVQVSIATGSLRQAMRNYEMLPLDGTFQIHKTTIGLKGRFGAIFPLDTYDGQVRVEGPDLVRLGEFLDIPLPNLPPYRLQAHLLREQGPAQTQTFNFENLGGTIGDSDVAGTLRVRTGGERPVIFTRLHSQNLDFDDLAGLVGGTPDPKETVSSEQKAEATVTEKRQKVFPDKPINFAQLQQVDADVEYRATAVKAPNLPLDDFLLDFVLQNGNLQIDRLNFGVAGGTIAMELGVNARKESVKAKLITEFDQVNLKEMLAKFEVGDDSFGTIAGRATVWMEGNSLANWLASADGGLYLTMSGGKVDALLVELAGLDFLESAAVFLNKDTGVTIECAYTDLQARSGQVTIQPFLLDTDDTKFKGFGEIDLRQERMDLTVHPYPKDFSLLSSRGPLHITGMLKNPKFSVEPSFPSPEFGTADDSERCLGMDKALKAATKAKNKQNKQKKTIQSVK